MHKNFEMHFEIPLNLQFYTMKFTYNQCSIGIILYHILWLTAVCPVVFIY